MNKSTPTIYIFDFDGTLADSLEAFIAVFNKLVRGNTDPLTAEEIYTLRGMTVWRAIRYLGLRWWQVPKLIMKGSSDFHKLVPLLKTFKGMDKTIKTLKQRGDSLYIVTSNTRESVDVFLEKNKLAKYFTGIYAGAGLYNKSKYINKLITTHDLKRKNCVYIGDEVRDINAARLSLIRIASVSWGFNTPELLKRHRPTYLLQKPEDLLDLRLHKVRKTTNSASN